MLLTGTSWRPVNTPRTYSSGKLNYWGSREVEGVESVAVIVWEDGRLIHRVLSAAEKRVWNLFFMLCFRVNWHRALSFSSEFGSFLQVMKRFHSDPIMSARHLKVWELIYFTERDVNVGAQNWPFGVCVSQCMDRRGVMMSQFNWIFDLNFYFSALKPCHRWIIASGFVKTYRSLLLWADKVF